MTRRVVIRELVVEGVAPGQEAAVIEAVRASLRAGLVQAPPTALPPRRTVKVEAPGAGPAAIGRATVNAVLDRPSPPSRTR